MVLLLDQDLVRSRRDLMQIDIGDTIEIRDRDLPGEVVFETTGVIK
jgi:hypothetical protein